MQGCRISAESRGREAVKKPDGPSATQGRPGREGSRGHTTATIGGISGSGAGGMGALASVLAGGFAAAFFAGSYRSTPALSGRLSCRTNLAAQNDMFCSGCCSPA